MKGKTLGLAALLLGGLLFFLPTAMHYTSQPSFCASCHEIRPYVTSWQQSAHHKTACFTCHAAPGLLNYIGRKVQGVKEVYVHLTQPEPKPKARITDSVCLSCHSGRQSGEKFGNVPETSETTRMTFSHRLHLAKEGLGSCLTCHAGVVHAPSGPNLMSTVCSRCHDPRPSAGAGSDPKTWPREESCLFCHKTLPSP